MADTGCAVAVGGIGGTAAGGTTIDAAWTPDAVFSGDAAADVGSGGMGGAGGVGGMTVTVLRTGNTVLARRDCATVGAGGPGGGGGTAATPGVHATTSSPGSSGIDWSRGMSSGTQKDVLHFGQLTWLPVFFRGTNSGCLQRGQSNRNGMASAPRVKDA